MARLLWTTSSYILTVVVLSLLFSCGTVPKSGDEGAGDAALGAEEGSAEGSGTPDERPAEDGSSSKEGETFPASAAAAKEGSAAAGPLGLSRSEIFLQSRRTIPDRFLFIEKDKSPLNVFHDLDGNGYRDALFLLVEKDPSLVEGLPEASFDEMVPKEVLDEVSRIYSDEVKRVDYYLSVFLQTEDELISMYRIPLGAWKVLEDFAAVDIVRGAQMPLCVSVSFQTEEGRERIWVIFSRYNKFSTVSLSDTVSELNETRDIDGDGILDIVTWSQVFEEGTGYETFLTWLKWNGRAYEQTASANVVRGLNAFLRDGGRLLQDARWQEAFSYLMNPSDYRRLRREGYGPQRIFALLFPEMEETEGAAEEAGAAMSDPVEMIEAAVAQEGQAARPFQLVVFPRIMENPFRRQVEAGDGPPYRIRLTVRFGTADGQTFVRRCTVQMQENPFGPSQFFLVPAAY